MGSVCRAVVRSAYLLPWHLRSHNVVSFVGVSSASFLNVVYNFLVVM